MILLRIVMMMMMMILEGYIWCNRDLEVRGRYLYAMGRGEGELGMVFLYMPVY